jgi:hypothetical protein
MPKPGYKLPSAIDVSRPFNTDEHRRRLKEDAGRLTPDSMSRELRELVFMSFNLVEPVRYLAWLATEHPAVYAGYVQKALIRDDESKVAGLTITVQQIVSEATPTPGVLASPIVGHIAPQRHLALVERVPDEVSP